MDWLCLGLVLLAVAGNIQAQQGYDYPKPKTPFSAGDSSTDSRLPTTPSRIPTASGTQSQISQRPFGSQQPSTGYTNGAQPQIPNAPQQTFGSKQSGDSGVSQRPFGTQQTPTGYAGSGIPIQQTPFGTQQPTAGYSSVGQTGTASFRSQPTAGYPGVGQTATHNFGSEQPSGGYPSDGQTGTPSFRTQQPAGTSGTSNFGSQQPSEGYPSGGQTGTPSFRTQQQPSGTYSGIGKTDKSSFGSQQPSGYPSAAPTGTPSFGSQQQSGGYPSAGPTGAPSFGSQQPSGGYPSAGLTGTPSSGSQQPSGGYPRPGSTGTPSFAPQQPSGGYPSTGLTGTTSFGSQQPSGGYPRAESTGTPGYGSQQPSRGSPGVGQTREPNFGSQQTHTQSPFGTRQPPTSYPDSSSASQGPLATPQAGYPGSRPTGQDVSVGSTGTQSSPSAAGRPQYPGQDLTGPSTSGRQNGYKYPTPQRPFSGATASTDNISAGGRSADSDSRTPTFGQSSTTSFGGSGLRGTSQFPTGGETISESFNPSGTQQQSNGYSQGGRQQGTLPSSTSNAEPNRYPQQGGSFGSTRPQQTSNGYSQSGLAQSSFPSAGSLSTTPQTSNGYAQTGAPQGSFPSSNKYPGVESQYPSREQQRSDKQGRGEFSDERKLSGEYSSGQSKYPGSGKISGSFGRQGGQPLSKSGFPERTAELQFPTNVPQSTGSVNGQVSNGYSTPAQGRFPSSSQQDKTGPSGYQQNEQRPLSSYLPPGVQGTGRLPLSDSPISKFPSGSFTPGGARESSGVSEAPTQSGNGYDNSPKPSGGISNGRVTSGTQVPSGRTSIDGTSSQLPSGLPNQSSRFQNGYDVSRTPSGRRQFETDTSTGRRPLDSSSEELQPQSGSQQGTNGYSKPGKTSDSFGRPGAAGRSEPGYSLEEARRVGFPRPTIGQTFPGSQAGRDFLPGQQRPSDEEGNFDEQDEGDYSAIPGQAGRDYPILSEVPETSFSCDDQEFRGYYADVETRCQIFHICANNKTYDFLCPNGTIFHQENLVCVWWNQFDCESAPSLYRINENIYDFSIIGAQQTGGIPVPGQDFPVFPEGGSEFGRQPGVGSTRPFQRPGGYRSEEGFTGTSGIQGPQGYPSGTSQDSTAPASTGQRPQGNGNYQIPSEGSQRPSTGAERPGGYPSERPQGPTTSSTGFSNGKPSGSRDYQIPNGAALRPTNEEFPSRTEPRQEGYGAPNEDQQKPGSDVQRPEGYPSGRPQGSTGSVVGGYRNGKPQGAGDYQSPTGSPSVGRVGGQIPQRPAGYPSGRPQETNGNQFPSDVPQGNGVQEVEGSTGGSQIYPSSKSTGTSGSQFSSPGQRVGQFRGEGISRPSDVPQTDRYPTAKSQDSNFPSGTGRQTPGEYGAPEGPLAQSQRPGVPVSQPRGYSNGSAPKPGFPSGQSSVPSGSGSPFPGSPQPHETNREYLPPV